MGSEDLRTGAGTYFPRGQLRHAETAWQLRLGFPLSVVPVVFTELKPWVTIQATPLLCTDRHRQPTEPELNWEEEKA